MSNFKLLIDLFNIVRRGLIYEVVEPVGIKQICAATPTYDRLFGIVIVREIVLGNIYLEPSLLIAQILALERIGIVFGMSRDKDLSALVGSAGENSCLL